jgi:hypothetical protein
MGLKGIICGNWFTRIVLLSWIISAVAIFILFKNMEVIVHGQLYYYNLQFSPDWADPYRFYTWLIYISLGLPIALSGIALASSFLEAKKVPEKKTLVPQRARPSQVNVKMEPQPAVKVISGKVENGNGKGICCPQCKKIFGRSLVMLDFRNGKNRMVSVCPYCNHILGYTTEEKTTNEKIYVVKTDGKKVH